MTQPTHSEYRALVAQRKTCTRCAPAGLTNPAAAGQGLDGDHIGPWTRWNGSLNAKVMVVGQEWGDLGTFVRQGGYDKPAGTNETLLKLLDSVGLKVDKAPRPSPDSQVFLTNAVLCLKQGGAQSGVSRVWFENCQMFLRRQVELVRPVVVVSLGTEAYLAIRREFSLPRISFRRAVRERKTFLLLAGVALVPVYHCADRVLRKYRSLDEQKEDWARVSELLAQAEGAPTSDSHS